MTFDATQDSYIAFRNIASERTKQVVVWIGAGLSKPAGCPLWIELRDKLCDVGHQRADQRPHIGEKNKLHNQCDAAKTMPLWNAFGLLRKALGKTSYKEIIKDQLKSADTAQIPDAYKKIWQLRPSGILSLNLDRLASRAYRASAGDKVVNEVIGRQMAQQVGLLKSPLPFVVYLHGQVNDADSWVMTDGELTSLFKQPGYNEFLTACFASRTVLFVGMNADDIAAGGHLKNLTSRGLDMGQHFWLTHRANMETDQWAESAGIRLINYRAPGNDHSELAEFFDDVLNFLPEEQFAPPVSLPAVPGAPAEMIPSPEELVRLSDENEIRTYLNKKAIDILRESTPEAYLAFDDFVKQYDKAIWRAWYVDADPAANKLLDFLITEEVAEGAFGKVYKATRAGSPDSLAIKVLHPDIRKNPEKLQSFRRGVRSMEILSTSNITGMVPYKEASEIPAFAVMEYIDGPNLNKAVRDGDIQSWAEVLRIALDLARIIDAAHKLPERVLHRDIRPANIMLRNFHRFAIDFEVLVLDFDLSWHKGAYELSVMSPQSASGFLAPEQVSRRTDVSTRHAAVDSFGLGMTFYFMRCREEPMFAQHMHSNWNFVLREKIASVDCSQWKSVPQRFARLIEVSTKDRQSERWDLSQIVNELERLRDAELNPASVSSAELFAEEIAQRSDMEDQYVWDADRTQAIKNVHGNTFVVRGVEPHHEVEIELLWSRQSGAKVGKYLRGRVEKSVAELKKGRWKTIDPDIHEGSVTLRAKIHISVLQTGLAAAVEALNQAIRIFDVH